MFDGKAFGLEIVAAVKAHIGDVLQPVIARIDAVERRLNELPMQKDGKDADPDAIAAIVRDGIAGELAAIKAAVDAFPAPVEFPELPDIAGMIAEAVSAIPEPMGEDTVKGIVVDAISALPPAEPGKDADPVEIEAAIKAEVERAVAAIEKPKDGHTPTAEEYGPMIAEAVAKAVAALPAPKDGIDAMDVMIDREGSLVFTMSDGRIKNVGLVVGKDGLDADMAALQRHASEMIAAIPKPVDGKNGLGWDDIEEELADDGRTLIRRYKRGDEVKEFRHTFAVVLDRGVYKEGQTYQPGDGVTWGGSFWIAQGETSEKPDTGKGWRLAIKKGRDGRDATVKPDSGPPKVKI